MKDDETMEQDTVEQDTVQQEQDQVETEIVADAVTDEVVVDATDAEAVIQVSSEVSSDEGQNLGDDETVATIVERDPAETRRAIEAILMVADQPVDVVMFAQLLELPTATIETTCQAMAAEFEADGRGFQMVHIAGGWRFQSHPNQAAYVERFALDGQVSRLSAAALETLAIVAYKQPISRAQIAQIRGVNVDGVMKTLVQRNYVAEIGIDPGPGQATLFGTTQKFLEGMGMGSVSDLAPLADFVPGAEIMEALEAGLRVDIAPDVGLDAPTETALATPESETAESETAESETAESETAELEAAELETAEADAVEHVESHD
jgi:segregation and condensation protein B